MEDVVIGSGDAKINSIVIAITECETYAKVQDNFTMLTKYLGTPPVDANKWNNDLRWRCDSLDTVLDRAILDFVSRKSKEATVFALAQAFEKAGLNTIGDMLREKFGRKVAQEDQPGKLNINDMLNVKIEDLSYISGDYVAEEENRDGSSFPKRSKSNDFNVVDLRSGKPLQNLKPISPSTPMKFNDDNYRLPIKKKGLALIINIISYGGLNDRKYIIHKTNKKSFT